MLMSSIHEATRWRHEKFNQTYKRKCTLKINSIFSRRGFSVEKLTALWSDGEFINGASFTILSAI